jgi:hypothetical protein
MQSQRFTFTPEPGEKMMLFLPPAAKLNHYSDKTENIVS